jgi:multisubunit Na+/H+ antiporter MnhC subunit
MDNIISFAQNHTVIVIALVMILLYLMYRKPKLFLGILLLGLFLAALFYFITSISRSGSQKEKRLFREEQEQFDTNR